MVKPARTAALPVWRVKPELVELEAALVVVLPDAAVAEEAEGATTLVMVELPCASAVVRKVVAVTAVIAPAAGMPVVCAEADAAIWDRMLDAIWAAAVLVEEAAVAVVLGVLELVELV